MQFVDREDAGKRLAESLEVSDPSNTVILALPRGGVPLGVIIAKAHNTAFDVLLSKKIGHPAHSEFAIGAVAEGGEPMISDSGGVHDSYIENEVPKIREEMTRRRKLYDQVLEKKTLSGKDVIIVDDGVATGMTVFAGIEAVKEEKPNSIRVAVPVIPRETNRQLEESVDYVSALDVPRNFLGAVGAYYQIFPQVSDDEVQVMLRESQK